MGKAAPTEKTGTLIDFDWTSWKCPSDKITNVVHGVGPSEQSGLAQTYGQHWPVLGVASRHCKLPRKPNTASGEVNADPMPSLSLRQTTRIRDLSSSRNRSDHRQTHGERGAEPGMRTWMRFGLAYGVVEEYPLDQHRLEQSSSWLQFGAIEAQEKAFISDTTTLSPSMASSA